MKNQNLLTNVMLAFWFGWFAIAGVLITAFINWIFSANYPKEDILVTGATVGIITGGIAALALFIIGKAHKLKGFSEST